MIERFLKRRAIKQYIKRMPRLLIQRYGRSNHYTPGQIKRTIEDSGLNRRYIYYAYAIFLTGDEFNALEGDPGFVCDFSELRTEIVKLFYGGSADFSVDTVMNIALGSGEGSSFGDGSGDTSD